MADEISWPFAAVIMVSCMSIASLGWALAWAIGRMGFEIEFKNKKDGDND